MNFSLVTLPAAEEALLRLFVDAPDRRRFEEAVWALEARLMDDPWQNSRELGGGVYTDDEPPVRLFFRVRRRDATVVIGHAAWV